uniref:Uncharacterized protein n=1 Tax=Oryza meridionalis TaxID=40149 RepID=A0A0E0DFN3_9ORYZ
MANESMRGPHAASSESQPLLVYTVWMGTSPISGVIVMLRISDWAQVRAALKCIPRVRVSRCWMEASLPSRTAYAPSGTGRSMSPCFWPDPMYSTNPEISH